MLVYIIYIIGTTLSLLGGGGATTASSGGNIGDPCDPETYSGPYQCVPDEDSPSSYSIAH